jgi:hypothetical protein
MVDSRKKTAPLSVVEKSADDERVALLAKIAELIEKAKSLGLTETAFLLNMAHLDLQTRIHGIEDDEMHAFIGAVRASIERH